MLFHVFTYYRTSLQIFLFHKFFCTNISQVELEILRNSSTIFRSSHQRCSIKKAILKHFVIFTGKYLCWGLFLNKVAGHPPCNFIKKRLQHRYFLANIRQISIYKKTYFEVHLRKCAFLESVLWERFSYHNLAKGTIDDLLWKVAQISQDWIKNASYNKVLGEEVKFLKKRLNSYIRAKRKLLEKVSCKMG